MSEARFTYFRHCERTDEQLVEDALKRAYPPVRQRENRFDELLARLRDVDRARDPD